MGKLTKLQVERAREPGRYGDGDGLWLDVSPTGAKSWLLRYQLRGIIRNMGLGSAKLVTLADARERARLARLRLVDGIDPLDERRSQRAAAASAITFDEAAKQVIGARADGIHRESLRQWHASITHVRPIIGHLPIAAIDTPLVLKCIEPLWGRKQVTADRMRQRIETVLNWARARGYRTGDNPARWKGHLEHVLKERGEVEHLAALPYSEVPAFIGALRDREGVAARALEFSILTACRTGEALGARWTEVEGEVWTVPAARMKARKEHTVPLAPTVTKLLDRLPNGGPFIFPGLRPGAPLERHAMRDMLKTIHPEITVHGFRSAFRDWAAEQTGYPPAVCEMALAHSISGKIEKAYRRGDLLDKRRKLMRDWATFCASTVKTSAAIVPLRGRRS